MSVGSRQRVEPVPLHVQKYLSEGYTLPITCVMQIHLNYSHILVKTLTALEPATSHFMRTEGSSRWQRSDTLLPWKPYFKLSKTSNALELLLTRTHISSQTRTTTRAHRLFITEILNIKLFSPHESARAGTDWPDPEILPEDQIWMNDWAERLSVSRKGRGVSWCCSFLRPTWTCFRIEILYNFNCAFANMFALFSW